MANQGQKPVRTLPETAELRKELKRTRFKNAYWKTLIHSASVLAVVAAIAVLVSMLWLPVLKIHGTSMSPSLEPGNIVIAEKTDNLKPGDIVAFYYNNRILVKRMIAGPGDWVDIDKDGNVKVNGQLLDEPYVTEKSLGESDIDYPYQVPDGRIFVLGDHRAASMNSRTKTIGTVADEQVVGKVFFRIWPLSEFGPV